MICYPHSYPHCYPHYMSCFPPYFRTQKIPYLLIRHHTVSHNSQVNLAGTVHSVRRLKYLKGIIGSFFRCFNQGTNISHLGKRKIIFKMPFLGDMLVPWRVYLENNSPFLAPNHSVVDKTYGKKRTVFSSKSIQLV